MENQFIRVVLKTYTPHRFNPAQERQCGINRKVCCVAPTILAALCVFLTTAPVFGQKDWRKEWPKTDFSKASVELEEIISGGPPKDGIPAIDNPSFSTVKELHGLSPKEPVISITINNDSRAYPVRVLMYHEIVNDTVGGKPVAITYCPLCNAAIVFERTVNGKTLDFGTTGKLRNSDLVMYDRQTESWWQQFTGDAIVGAYTGTQLMMLPTRLEAYELFVKRAGLSGKVLIPYNDSLRSYGKNPYVGYDSAPKPFLYRGIYQGKLPPLARVVAVGNQAWSLELLREKGTIKAGRLILSWTSGQNSALDAKEINQGRDVGNVVVQRKARGRLEDVVYHVTFAFAFKAFHPNGIIYGEPE